MEQVEAQVLERPAGRMSPPKPEQGWDAQPADPRVMQPGITDPEIAEWSATRVELRDLAKAQSLSMGEAGRRGGIPGATLSSWYAGKYRGSYANTTGDVRRWLAAYAEQREASLHLLQEPGFVETPTSREVMTTLVYAQALGVMSLVTLGSGMGKTSCIKQTLRTRPHVWNVTMSPVTRKVPALLRALASAVNAPSAHPGQLQTLIGEKLQRNGRQTLLLVDEAQHLDDDAVNQLRYFNDEYGCGIVLLGNEDAYQRWAAGKPKLGYGQLHSRFADRLRVLKPRAEDIAVYVAAWGITDPAVVRLLTTIGHQPGALRQIAMTIKSAGTIAGPEGRPISVGDIRQAWARRSGGEVLP